MLWVPTASDDVINVTVPEDSVPMAILFRPSKNVTVPLGVPPDPDTVAVNVTDWPEPDGLTFYDTIVELVTGDEGTTSNVAAKVSKYDDVVSHGFGRLSFVR